MKTFAKIAIRVVFILIIIALAGALRARAVEKLPPDYDEDDYLRAGQLYAEGVRAGDLGVFLRENYRPEHPPLAKIVYGFTLLTVDPFPLISDQSVQAAINQNLPPEPLKAARASSAWINLLEVAILAVINPLAGLFLGIHTFTIKYASQVMLESLPSLTSLLVVVCYLRYQKSNRKRPVWWILSALFLGLTAASKYYFVISGLAVAAHWLWSTRPQDVNPGFSHIWKWVSPLLAWGGLALLIFFAADPYLWPDPLNRLKESVLFHGGYAASDQVRQAGYPWWQPLNWLMISVPWHPGVFLVSIDILITVLALFGLARARNKHPVYMLWLALGLGFLLVWPTKWPQYILLVTAPLSLAAAEGFKAHLAEPFWHWLRTIRFKRKAILAVNRPRYDRPGRVLPWLLPGVLALAAIAIFPLIYQAAIAMTDFQSSAIKDGLTGGVFREVWQGVSGQVEPNLDALSGGRPSTVHYAGLYLLFNVLLGAGSTYVFEILWTILAVTTQLALGIGVALLLQRRGVLLKRAWTALFILPWAIPEFIAALSWSQIFEPRFGFISLAARPWAQQAPEIVNFSTTWQKDPNLALLVLLSAALWYGFPFMFLSAAAGLKMIPQEVYDAAAIDGAFGVRLFRFITWPLIFPLLVPAIIIRAIFAFNQFYLFALLNPPMVTFATGSYFIFSNGNYALSAAINIVILLILILLISRFTRLTKAGEGVSYG
jgi:ABC-type sugar transport system permease subunit